MTIVREHARCDSLTSTVPLTADSAEDGIVGMISKLTLTVTLAAVIAGTFSVALAGTVSVSHPSDSGRVPFSTTKVDLRHQSNTSSLSAAPGTALVTDHGFAYAPFDALRRAPVVPYPGGLHQVIVAKGTVVIVPRGQREPSTTTSLDVLRPSHPTTGETRFEAITAGSALIRIGDLPCMRHGACEAPFIVEIHVVPR